MLDPSLLHSEPDAVTEKLARRGLELDTDKLDTPGERRKALQVRTENLQAGCNSRSKFTDQAKARGRDIELLRLEVNKSGEELDIARAELDALQAEIRDIALTIPSLLADGVLVGKDENDNVGISRWGIPRKLDFEVRDHVTLGGMYSGLDFAVAIKLTGSRFVVMKGQVARMHRTLSQFMLDLHIGQHGYSGDYVPYLVSRNTLYDTGQLPKFAGDLFYTRPLEEKASASNYALIPTAEVPLTNPVRDGIISEDDLPVRTAAHTSCFRPETSLYDRDTRDLIRVHQLDKVEMMQIVCPEDSMAVLEGMTGHAERVLQLLSLSYRKTTLCTGDMGSNACKTYDLGVWILVQNTYREISSCSNVQDLQVRRMQARCRSESGKKTHLVHALSGSGLAVGRMLVAVMENYQQADGRIEVLEVLHPYMNGLEYIG